MILGMRAWVMVVVVWVRIVIGEESPNNHNKNEYEALCSVLSSAVTIFESGRGSSALKKALEQAIFGSKTQQDKLESLLWALPQEFQAPGDRQNWCGVCANSHHYPGKSIPHDMLCLCTVGGAGYPFSYGASTLCGKSARELGCSGDYRTDCSGSEGWTESKHGEPAKTHVRATWDAVVKPCFRAQSPNSLEETRNTLMKHLKPPDGYSPIWGRGHSYCGGTGGNVCLNYPNPCGPTNFPQWVKDLSEALEKEDFAKAENTSTGPSTTTPKRNGVQPQVGRTLERGGEYSQAAKEAEIETPQHHTNDGKPISHPSEKENDSTIISPIGLLCVALIN
ncbi:Variant surface glycoprotein [Trypanosoma congolense IL3000]|uniref:Variant surface glycoprotein n=1 Tax=Trypanosoma congolense (strain IL3000) TaxID=1068625 RepID=F9W9I0_TRYCI|nr:Variant surface glycoprotein [Trypanosoma congolense IL3000]